MEKEKQELNGLSVNKGLVINLGKPLYPDSTPLLETPTEKSGGFNKTERLQHELYHDWRHPEEPVGYLLRKHKQNTFKDKLVTPQDIISPANRRAMESVAKLLK